MQIQPKRLAIILGIVTLITGIIILCLLFIHIPTVVEMKVTTDGVSFTVLPTHSSDSPLSLLDESLKVRSIEWTYGAVLEKPKTQQNTESIIQISRDIPFNPKVQLFKKTNLNIQPYINQLLITLNQESSESKGWQNIITGHASNKINLKENINQQDNGKPIIASSQIRIIGSKQDARVVLDLISEEKHSSTSIKIIDLNTGREIRKNIVSVDIPQQHLIFPRGNRLIILEKELVEETATTLFTPDIDIQQLKFYRLSDYEIENYLIGGQIRFLGKEREDVELGKDFLLKVNNNEPLKLKSMQLINGHLQLVLWGRPSSISLGPTPGLMSELLPNCFIWLYTHKLGTLVFSTIGGMLTLCISVLTLCDSILKLFGVSKKVAKI